MATTAPEKEPHPHARAAIGRALGRFGLDRRKGVGLRADGLPDIDWGRIPGDAPFTYQDGVALRLATFHIARYPITHAQFQAFVDAGAIARTSGGKTSPSASTHRHRRNGMSRTRPTRG